MKDIKFKAFNYKCQCGYNLNVFIDFGMPKESIKCRMCKKDLKREA